MVLTLYYTDRSFPSRAALMTAHIVCGSNVVLKRMNFAEKEHMKPEFLKVTVLFPNRRKVTTIICNTEICFL